MSDNTDKQTNSSTPVTTNRTKALTDKWQMSAEDEQYLLQNSVHIPMGYNQLKTYLPHRYPFMLIDRVTAACPNTWISGYKNITINEPFFQGHFPQEPIMPGVLIVEAMAQISGVLTFISEGITAEDGHLFLFAGVDKVRFRTPVVPGDKLVLKSELLLTKRNIYKFECRAFVEDKLAASAELMIIRQDRALDR